MSSNAFEYDVFISFATANQDTARPLWQELGLSGLRVFWSDSALRDRVGSSWFEVIQDALDRSRHLVVLFTPEALQSTWVKREYVAFFNHCYKPPMRLLVPVLAPGVTAADLPLFLRELEACRLDDSLGRKLARLLGGTDVEGLRVELSRTQELLRSAEAERDALRARLAEVETALRERQQPRAADEAPSPPPPEPEPQKKAPSPRTANGLRLFLFAATLNAILAMGTIIAEDQQGNVNYAFVTYLAGTLFMATIPGILWFVAGVIVPHRNPFVSAVVPALIVFITGTSIGGVDGAYWGIILNGLGPLVGSAVLMQRGTVTAPPSSPRES